MVSERSLRFIERDEKIAISSKGKKMLLRKKEYFYKYLYLSSLLLLVLVFNDKTYLSISNK
jgi:hypothetical protein